MTARSLMMEVHKTERNASEQTRGIKDKYTWRRRAIRKWDRDRRSSDRALREALRQDDVCQKKMANDRSPRVLIVGFLAARFRVSQIQPKLR
jgi:GH35 family endo-1,4-beta-xylanase